MKNPQGYPSKGAWLGIAYILSIMRRTRVRKHAQEFVQECMQQDLQQQVQPCTRKKEQQCTSATEMVLRWPSGP
eukprot:223852-Pelagomonas_calceolata.AAC.3